MIHPGTRNLITDIDGLCVGNAVDEAARTGTTILLCDRPMAAAVDVRGGAPGTRNTDLLAPDTLINQVDAICLSGGSEFGLDAAGGAVAWLAQRGRGLQLGVPVTVPIVPAAILFDLGNGGDKGWGTTPPYRDLAWQACAAAGHDFGLGNAGAGLGAKAAEYKGGLGSASAIDDITGCTVAALIAANPLGCPVMPGQDSLWAWPFELAGELGGQPVPTGPVLPDSVAAPVGPLAHAATNTTIGIVAVDADLTPAELRRLAIAAQDGIARAVRPAHTIFDGDTLFAVAAANRSLAGNRNQALYRLGAIAADVVTRALARGVFAAGTLGARIAYRERHGSALREGRP